MDTIDTLLGITSGFLNNTTFQAILALTAGLVFVLLILMHPSTAGTPKDKKIALRDWLGLTGSFVTERYRPMGRAIMVVAVLICGVLVASGVMAMIGLWAALWDIIDPTATEKAAGDNVRGIAFALAAIFGLPFLVWRSVVAQQQANISEQGQITDRISKAVEQLGAMRIKKESDGTEMFLPNLEVRIGGIYALERIAQDSLRDHVQIMEILCAYVRENAPASGAVELPAAPEYPEEPTYGIHKAWEKMFRSWEEEIRGLLNRVRPRTDIQAVLKVIGRRNVRQQALELEDTRHHSEGYRLDLRHTNLQGADLRRQHFERALFSETRLENANLSGTELGGAYLKGAFLTLAQFHEAKMNGTIFRNSTLQCTFFFKAHLKNAVFTNTNLQGSVFAHANLQNANLTHTKGQIGNFKNAWLRGVKFLQAELEGANFIETRLQDSSFLAAHLQYAKMYDAILNGSTEFQFSHCLHLAVKGSDFSENLEISQFHIDQMFGDSTTKLPPNITPPPWHSVELSWGEFYKQWDTLKNKPS